MFSTITLAKSCQVRHVNGGTDSYVAIFEISHPCLYPSYQELAVKPALHVNFNFHGAMQARGT